MNAGMPSKRDEFDALHVSDARSDESVAIEARRVADHLKETNEEARQVVLELIVSQGLAWVEQLVEESERLRGEGKLRRFNGEARTPGGAFLRLARKRLGPTGLYVASPAAQAQHAARVARHDEQQAERAAKRRERKKRQRSELYTAQQELWREKALKSELDSVDALERAYRANHRHGETPSQFVLRRHNEGLTNGEAK